jgi:signal peptide peptidase SppA
MDFSSAIRNQAWAIMPESINALVERMRTITPAAVLPRRDTSRTTWESSGSRIAVLPLLGMLSQRNNPMVDFAGDTSLEAFAGVFNQLLKDSSISSIVLDVDSPGGSVYGVDELAARIFAARGQKRIVAIANSLAASAAYWIATAAGELSCTPSGQVGSIGIVAVHEDWSRAEDAAGLKVTQISAGKFKAEGNEHEPLDDTARAALQDRIDDHYGMFVKSVARGRGVSQASVRDGFGEGRTVGATAALKMGMVDRVETIDELLARLAASPAGASISRSAARGDFLDEVQAAQARLRAARARVGQ